jgi:hypothetical protein
MREIWLLPVILYKMKPIDDRPQEAGLSGGKRGSIPSCTRFIAILAQDEWCHLVVSRSASTDSLVPEGLQDMDYLVPGLVYSWYKTVKINNPLAEATASPPLLAGIGDRGRGLEFC